MRNNHLILLFILSQLFSMHAHAQKQWRLADSAFTFMLNIDSVRYNDSSGFYDMVKSIDIYKNGTHEKVQTIIPPSDNSFENYLNPNQVFIIEDMNFDGRDDFRLLKMLDTRLQSNFYYWLYDPSKGFFEQDTVLEQLTNPVFNRKTKKIETSEEIGASDQEECVYHYSPKGKLVLEYQKSQMLDLSGTHRTTKIRKLVNGKMKETTSVNKE